MTRKRKSEPIDHGLDPILEYMRGKGLPMDREHYLAVCFPEGVPDKLSAEEEAELPEVAPEAVELAIDLAYKKRAALSPIGFLGASIADNANRHWPDCSLPFSYRRGPGSQFGIYRKTLRRTGYG